MRERDVVEDERRIQGQSPSHQLDVTGGSNPASLPSDMRRARRETAKEFRERDGLAGKRSDRVRGRYWSSIRPGPLRLLNQCTFAVSCWCEAGPPMPMNEHGTSKGEKAGPTLARPSKCLPLNHATAEDAGACEQKLSILPSATASYGSHSSASDQI
jgi:hypothetical protein